MSARCGWQQHTRLAPHLAAIYALLATPWCFDLATLISSVAKYVLSASNGSVVLDRKGTERGSLNNFDPTTYDVPGQFGYLKLTVGL
jgi:hypothetical protein